MDEKDFQDLLNEIDSMSIEEYNKYHEKALKMKETGVYICLEKFNNPVLPSPIFEEPVSGSFSTENTLDVNSQFSAAYMKVDELITNIERKGEIIWAEAA